MRGTQVGRFSAIVGAGATIAIGISAFAPTGAMAAETEDTAPRTTVTSKNPGRGTIMPNFSQEALPSSTNPGFAITIDSSPAHVRPGEEFTIRAHTTGFAPGNWINVWVKQADGSMLDAGGFLDEGDGQVEISARLVAAGATTVQLSSGTWPQEQWSQPISIEVSEPELNSVAAVAFHDLSGKPIILATTKQSAFTDKMKPRNVLSFALPAPKAQPLLVEAEHSDIEKQAGQPAKQMQLTWTARYSPTAADGSLSVVRPGTPLDASTYVKCRMIEGPVYAVGQDLKWVTEPC